MSSIHGTPCLQKLQIPFSGGDLLQAQDSCGCSMWICFVPDKIVVLTVEDLAEEEAVGVVIHILVEILGRLF